jgi:hypothetical protein
MVSRLARAALVAFQLPEQARLCRIHTHRIHDVLAAQIHRFQVG